ncbi:dolichyl-phosphate-mannose-protein mannosyltransferase [Anseongella ginsenosidimutans]|uniref:Dolichyl-phosphate-mannose-protein mannosyltransferase n=1 Tax=Anseongella ginsenosidimutans TaxID=496056 RepID=A0A4R3KRG4_9SPHI|nr:glycosyltransferase family 39 protein [Anseongella ginsenosidimutans]QEC52312.1 glycosyltransferase family 39 protein [Anseongella ginsenosidimutans]TCS86875.1 dolichyl-phosphate-mannose-protein mannosyltransferase [Anseongella ginsenosidimutans]
MNGRKQALPVDKALVLLRILAFVKFLLPFLIVHPAYELHRDEFLYLAEARHLDWGYLEAPPLLSLLAWVSLLSGDHEFWVRLWPAIFGALTFLLAGKIVLRLGGKGPALFLLFLAFIFTAFLRLHFLFQPNFLDVFFWTLAAYWVFRYIDRQENKFIYLLGFTAGLGFLSKYSVAIFLLALAVALALSPQRKLFAGKHLYLAALTGLLIFLPNLIWQYLHNFPVLHHMEELHETQLRHVSPLSFLSEQLLMTLPVFFIWLTGLCYTFFHTEGKKYIVFGWTFLLVMILLILFQGKGYYALGIYPVLLALGAFRLEQMSQSRRWIRYAGISFILLAGMPLIPVLLPIWAPPRLAQYYQDTGLGQTGILQWEDLRDHALPQDFADMLGRKELLQKTVAALREIPAPEQKNTIILCDNYGQAGALNYYGYRSGLPQAISVSASFLLWVPDYRNIAHIIRIGDGGPEDAGLQGLFAEVTVTDSITAPMAREFGTKIRWFRSADSSVTPLLNEAVKKMQQRFR